MEAQSITVKDTNGDSGVLEASLQEDWATLVPVRLPSGALVQVERDLLEAQEEGSYHLRKLTFRDLEAAAPSPDEEELVIPVAEERVHVRKHKRETGRVHIEKQAQEHTETVETPLVQERVDVERVPIGRTVDEPVQTRREGQTVIVPVMEERLVVRKELVLKEELRVTVRQTEHLATQEVALHREAVDVQRTRSEDAPHKDPPRKDPPRAAETEMRASGE